MADRSQLLSLVERFERNLPSYKSGSYNETQLRREFLDPLFKLLGWDMDNEQGYAEAYKDVIHEDAIKIGGATKAPDYCFRIGGTRKFFLEAKKPSVFIKEEIPPAYQIRRYAWSAKLPLSILCDFEELAVYDCRIRPEKRDTAATARIMYLTFRDYAEKWDEIAAIFSRDAVLKGSFDRYVETTKAKKGTTEVDAAFLKEIESWRSALARNLALRNTRLTQRELNFSVQRIIDRIIFLRICEDRGIEEYGRLLGLVNGSRVYARLKELFHKADDRYNSGLFHFRQEKGRAEPPDELTLDLKIDDDDLAEMIRRLYYPDSPYEFSVLPADILGQVYEQFLGKVIRLTAGHRAVVEDKPEVKKAGGVYYTPTYIVDYIVRNTVGALLNPGDGKKSGGKTPKEVSTLRILDPACGSGSFLLGAFQYLLDWHRDYYSKEPAKYTRELFQAQGGDWRLTTAEKKRILLNNIYGVDIDAQAVETTKLSLLLKVLEGESDESLTRQFKLFHERALPDLARNIKCGNSLIGPDFYEGQQMNLLDEEERYKINVFDWQTEFSDVFDSSKKEEQRGFDVVIGNPPYVRIQTLSEWSPLDVQYFKQRFTAGAKGNYDLYVLFIERSLMLMNNLGRCGYILPNKFMNSQYGEAVRQLVSNGKNLAQVVHFGSQQIFQLATTYTCLLFTTKARQKEFVFQKVDDIVSWRTHNQKNKETFAIECLEQKEWNFAVGKGRGLIERLGRSSQTLEEIAEIFVGLQTSADDVLIMESIKETRKYVRCYSKSLDCEWDFERDLLLPMISGMDVRRYNPFLRRQFVLFPYSVRDNVATLFEEAFMRDAFPSGWKYLVANKKKLENREKGKFKDPAWYRFGRNQNLGIQSKPKICVPRLVKNLCATLDGAGAFSLDNVDVGGITLRASSASIKLRFLLALINSTLLRWYFPNISAPFRGGWYSANRQFLGKLPLPKIDPNSAVVDRLGDLAQQQLDLHTKLGTNVLTNQRDQVQRQISALDRQIDGLVYELYGLTEDEIRIVEESTVGKKD